MLGRTTIRPSIRTIEGPEGAAKCEPRAMQVLLALIDGHGSVLARDDLIELCWDGRIVGDDAINRAVAAIRRTGAETGADFTIETIPRIGYRLTWADSQSGEPPGLAGVEPRDDLDGAGSGLSRRAMLAGSISTAAILGATAWGYFFLQERADYLARIGLARRLLNTQDGIVRAQQSLEELAESYPDRPEAWGLLAYARYKAAEMVPFQETGAMVSSSEEAAERALSLDAEQSDALLAIAMLRFSFADWKETEDRVRQVIDIAPDNVEAIEFLVVLLQCVGRCEESSQWLNRAIAIRPMQPSLLFKKALKHWIFGRVADADRVIDGALNLWPRNEWVWNTRLMIYAFTGRPRAAITMLEDRENRPASMLLSTASVWRTALIALDSGLADDIAKARDAILQSAPHGPANAGQGVMLLSSLGELDAAYEIANGLLLARGRSVGSIQASIDPRLINSQSWRRTQWLFIPATENLRGDDRFSDLCRDLGLLDYWRMVQVWPDDIVIGSLKTEVA